LQSRDNNVRPKKRIPERKCIGCSESKAKNELIRIVRAPDGSISIDFTGKLSGRGAYICRSLSCFRKARKSKRLEHSLESAIPDEVYDGLERKLQQDEDKK